MKEERKWEGKGVRGAEGERSNVRSRGTCVHFESFVLRGRICRKDLSRVSRGASRYHFPFMFHDFGITLEFSADQACLLTERKVQWDGDTIVMIIVRCTADRKRESGDQRSASINGAKRLIQRSYIRIKMKKRKKKKRKKLSDFFPSLLGESATYHLVLLIRS